MNPDDTIVAIGSPPAPAERGIVRLSGPRAFECADAIFTARAGRACCDVDQVERRTGSLAIADESVEAAALLFPAGSGYTGQPAVEFHLTGSPIVLGMVVEALIARGARPAEPGEFTARAFLMGRIDLSQAHGVAGMIAARSDQQLRAAERLLHGALGTVAGESREALADLLSLVEGAMDFADEPIEFIQADALCEHIGIIRDRLRTTVDAALRAERWDALPRVVMTGAPNAGKSTLLNRLCGTARAISADVAGTTRDVISVTVRRNDCEFLLIDAAGRDLAATNDVSTMPEADDLAGRADHAAAEATAAADVVLILVDLNRDARPTALARALDPRVRRLVVGNKADLAEPSRLDALRRWAAAEPGCEAVGVSAITGAGCDALLCRVASMLSASESRQGDGMIALMAEHHAALTAALDAMDRALAFASRCDSSLQDADLVAAELRIAAESLGAIVGMDQTEDMLGRIFARFCVGK